MATKIRSTRLKKLTPRRRVTRLKPVEYIPEEQPTTKTRIIPIPIVLKKIPKITPAKIPKVKTPKIKPGVGIIGGPGPQGKGRIGKVLGGPVQSSVASAVWYWPQSLLMVVDFHGGAEYEYYQTDYNLFNYIYNGLGVAKTDGQNQYGRWWKGKSNPSVGASIHQRLQSGMINYKRVK